MPVAPRRFAAAIALCLTACSNSTGSGSGTGASTTAASICANDPRTTSYAVGLSATSPDGAFTVTFVDANPAPPTKGTNAWTVKITDDAGHAVTRAMVTAKPYMPDHGHGSSITPEVMEMGSDGTYEVSLLDLFMPGIWQVTFSITPASGSPDTAAFTFCIDG